MDNQKQKTSTIIGSDKGGVGKSLISQLIALIYDNANVPLRVIEIDNQKKLTAALGENRVDLSLTAFADINDLDRRPHLAVSFFNPVYHEWQKDRSLTDLGANVTSSLFAWFRHCEIETLAKEDNIRFQFVSCASPDEQALKSAINAIYDAKNTFGSMAQYFIVLNEMTASCGFDPYKDNEHYQEIIEMGKKGEIHIVEIPSCRNPLYENGQAKNMNLQQIISNAQSLAEDIGMDSVTLRIQKNKLMNWVKEMQNNLNPIISVK